jgi:hypothetical protein
MLLGRSRARVWVGNGRGMIDLIVCIYGFHLVCLYIYNIYNMCVYSLSWTLNSVLIWKTMKLTESSI